MCGDAADLSNEMEAVTTFSDASPECSGRTTLRLKCSGGGQRGLLLSGLLSMSLLCEAEMQVCDRRQVYFSLSSGKKTDQEGLRGQPTLQIEQIQPLTDTSQHSALSRGAGLNTSS